MEDFFEDGPGMFVGMWLVVVVLILTTFGLIKLGGAMFNVQPATNLSKMSIQTCEKAKGTPVLEDNGNAYKACAINGHESTRNVVGSNAK